MADTRIETLPAPTQPSDLDGWSADDLEAWLPDAARKVAAAEVTIDEMRTAVGLVLYRLRIELGDGKYGEAVDRVARDAGLTAATLGRWRTAAERHFQLPAPSVRTVAQRAREADPLTRRQKRKPKEIAAAPAVPPARANIGSVPSSEVAKPVPGTTECPRCHGSGRVEVTQESTQAGRCTCTIPTLSKSASNICAKCHRVRRGR